MKKLIISTGLVICMASFVMLLGLSVGCPKKAVSIGTTVADVKPEDGGKEDAATKVIIAQKKDGSATPIISKDMKVTGTVTEKPIQK